jgi:hypothetical protein
MAGDGDTHGRPDSEISAKMGEVCCGQPELISVEKRALVVEQFY